VLRGWGGIFSEHNLCCADFGLGHRHTEKQSVWNTEMIQALYLIKCVCVSVFCDPKSGHTLIDARGLPRSRTMQTLVKQKTEMEDRKGVFDNRTGIL